MENVPAVSLPVILTPNSNILKNGVSFNVMLPVDNKSSTRSSSLIASYSMIMCLLSKMVSGRFLCSCIPTCGAIVLVALALLSGKNYVRHCLLWLDTQEEWIVCTVFLVLYTAVSFPLTWGYILLNLACGYHFGLFAGTVVTAIEASIGIVLAHILMKHYFVGVITARILNLNSVRSTLAVLESTHAFKLIAISRLTPIPFGLQNALFAISPICTWRYVWASAVGLLPTQVISVYLGTTVRSMEDVLVNENAAVSYGVLIIQVLLSVVLFAFILRRARRELNKAMSGDLKEILVQNGKPDSRCRLNLRSSGRVMEGLERVTRESLSRIRNSDGAVIYLKEVRGTDTDERNWSFSYLREQLSLKNSQELFRKYQMRVQHALFMELLWFNLLYNALALVAFVMLPEEETGVVVFAQITRAFGIIINMVMFLASYKESLFRGEKAKTAAALVILLTMMTGEQGTSVYRLLSGHVRPTIRSTYYIVLTTSVLLPFSRKIYCAFAGTLVILVELLLSGFSTGNESENRVILISADAVFLLVTLSVGLYIRYLIEVMSRRAFLDRRECIESKIKIEMEKNQEEKFLQTILPQHIAKEVRQDIRELIKNRNRLKISQPFNKLYVEKHKGVSILYADIVNSMLLAASLKVGDLVATLNDLFGRFDDSAEKNNCMRIKLLGDCYYCVSGVPVHDPKHADNCVTTGLDMIDVIRSVREKRKVNVDMRIGVHSGNILCGLLGLRKWQFDIWSRDVTVASHMEQSGIPGHVHITKATKDQLKNEYDIRPGDGHKRDDYLQREGIETFLISPRGSRTITEGVPGSPSASIKVETPHFRRQSSSSNVQKVHARINKRSSSGTDLIPKRRRAALDYSLHQYQQLVYNVNKIMENAIDKMALSKKDQWFSNEGIQPLLLTFRNWQHEKPYLQQPDPLFKYYLLCMILIFTGITIIHLLIMSKTLVFWITYGVTLLIIVAACVPTWAGYLWITLKEGDDVEILSSAIMKISRKVWQTVAIRIAIWLTISTMLLFCSMLGLNECFYKSVFDAFASNPNNTSLTTTPVSIDEGIDYEDTNCSYPWFYTMCAVLAMTTTSVFLRINFMLKLLLNAAALAGFWYVIDVQGETVFQQKTAMLSDWEELGRPVDQSHCFFLTLVVIILHVLDRQVEYVCRLDYLWKTRLREEQKEADTMELVNRMLLDNILPEHVRDIYLNKYEPRTEDVYHEEYTSVAVMFASIPNFANFYYEDDFNEEGLRCIQLLNEIICDFDQLLFVKSYSKVEKIKTIGSTYMVACGLQVGSTHQEMGEYAAEENPKENVTTLVRFATDLMVRLQQLNKDAMQEFQLRVGISVGPVMAGVVGTVKPQYDIWGDTVNVASRMDTTGITGRIQVSKEVAEIVQAAGTFKCECRGEIYVKGKGKLTTYLLQTPYDEPYFEHSKL